MKRIVFTLFLLFTFSLTVLWAQVNPKPGYIITLGGDTLRGTIDYRTDGRNARVCLFCREGDAEFGRYSPADISGYRLTDNGAFYVSRRVPIDGEEKTLFLEYLIKGGVSLFYHTENARDYYFFVDAGGNVALYEPSVDTDSHLAKDIARERRRKMADVMKMFDRSPETIKQLWEADANRRQLANITRRYNERYCKETGECVQFEFDDEKTVSVITRLRIQAGVATASLRGEDYEFRSDMKFSVLMPQIAIGLDFQLPRVRRGFAVETLLQAALMNKEGKPEKPFYDPDADYALKALALQWQLGAACDFSPSSAVSPMVHGGLLVNQWLKLKDTSITDFYASGHNSLISAAGAYVGAGVDVAMGRHSLRLAADVLSPMISIRSSGKLIKRNLGVQVGLGWLF